MNWVSARSRRAAAPHRTVNRDFAIFAARAKSRRPSASPSSSWGLGMKPNARGVPQRRTSTFCASVVPGGTDGSGRFGIWRSTRSSSASTRWSSASSALMRSPTSRIRAISPAGSSPRRFAWPIVSEARFLRALSSSLSLTRRRREASRSSTLFTSSAPPRSASPRATASGSSRISRRSSNGRLLRFDRRGAFGFDAGDGADVVVRVELDDADAPGVAALGGDVGGVEADELALGRHDEDVVAIAHLEHGDDVAVATAGLDVDDPLARPALEPVLLERRPLAVPALGHGEDRDALLHDIGADNRVALFQLDASHASRAALHQAHLLLRV